MKKQIGLLLVLALTLGSLASCSGETVQNAVNDAVDSANNAVENAAEAVGEAVENVGEAAENVAEDVGEAVENAAENVGEAVENAAEEVKEAAAEVVVAGHEEGTVFDQMDTWHWRTFECQYIDGDGTFSGSARGGHYENDEMAEFLEQNPEWYKDTAMMEGWEEMEGPFGDRIVSAMAGSTPFTADPDNNHGLMVYKSFKIDDVSEDTLYELIMFYDNTIYCYINGVPYFINDTNCGADGNDWTDDYVLLKSNQEEKPLKDFLHEGDNYICASIKDCWGGREFDAYMTYEKGSTKRDIELIPQESEWQYTVFNAPYIDGNGEAEGSAAGGHFEPDEMADYIAAHPDYMTDTATASSWPTGKAPMSGGAEGWEGPNHGLFLYKPFTVDNLDEVKNCDEFNLYGDYDNAVHVFLNGVEIYTDDGETVTQDWQYGINAALDKDLVLSALKGGENYLFVTVKDAWGGREWNCGFRAHWN